MIITRFIRVNTHNNNVVYLTRVLYYISAFVVCVEVAQKQLHAMLN